MHDTWIWIAVFFVLGLCGLALVGLVSVIQLLARRGSSKPIPDSLEGLQEVLQQHEERLKSLEGKSPSSRRASLPTPPPLPSGAKTLAKSSASAPSSKAGSKNFEDAVAGRWFQWVALAALLFGMGYFLKLAFDNNWIGPMGRVALGWVVGIAFLIQGHRWFNRYPVWAHSLAGAGLGFLYLSTYAAFQFYTLLGSQTAFGIMVLTTAAGAAMAVADKSRVLAVFTLIGGFLTPALVSTGENHQVALMNYLLLLNFGVFLLSVFGGWRFLRWGAWLATVFYCAAWGDHFYRTDNLWVTLGFHTAFYLLFALTSWFQDFQKRKDTDQVDAFFCAVNAAAYFGSSYALLTNRVFAGAFDAVAALLALALSAFYAWQSGWTLKNRAGGGSYLATILLGLAAAFFATAIPVYLNKGWITVGWSVEATFLLWTGLREARAETRWMAYVVLGFAAFRLIFFDWSGTTETLFFNSRLIPYGTALGSVVVAILLLDRSKPRAVEANGILPVLAIGGNLVALLYLSLEVSDYWNRQTAVSLWNAKALSLSVLWLLYAAGMMAAGFIKDFKGLRLVAIMTFVITILKVFLFDLSELHGGYRVLSLIILGLILLMVSFVYQNRAKKSKRREKE